MSRLVPAQLTTPSPRTVASTSRLAPRHTSIVRRLLRRRLTALVLSISVSVANLIEEVWIQRSTISGYTQTLRPGVKASFGLALDTQKLNDPNPAGAAHTVSHSFS